MAIDVSISPHGSLVVEALPTEDSAAPADPVEKRVLAAFAAGAGRGAVAPGDRRAAIPAPAGARVRP